MKNIDRLTQHITKYGIEGNMIHSIPNTNNWIVAQKIEINKWALILMNPMGNVSYNLGTVTDEEHVKLWNLITRMEIENKASQIMMAKNLREEIKNFIKSYEKTYKNFIKIEEKNINKTKKTKHRRTKLRRKSK